MWCWIPENQGKSELEKEISVAFINLFTTRGGFFVFFFLIMGNKFNSIRKEKREDANLILSELKNLVKITVEREQSLKINSELLLSVIFYIMVT